MPSASVMFWISTRCVARDKRRKVPILRRSSSIRATSAVSMAVPVPAAPMAKPISARASAGASLMPSPTMPTWPSPPPRRSMVLRLSSGGWSPRASAIPPWAALAAAGST
ncbi:hypothetical protein G6F68_020720 [Rhizopus microsporus]|nr:hypothetical protein G6F68_020720 [Rhizopus microsporus]